MLIWNIQVKERENNLDLVEQGGVIVYWMVQVQQGFTCREGVQGYKHSFGDYDFDFVRVLFRRFLLSSRLLLLVRSACDQQLAKPVGQLHHADEAGAGEQAKSPS